VFSGQWDEKEVIRIRAAVLRRMQAVLDRVSPGVLLRARIVVESHRTPTDWQRDFNLFRGSAFGLTHNLQVCTTLRIASSVRLFIRFPSY